MLTQHFTPTGFHPLFGALVRDTLALHYTHLI